jgi:hypothetical protein
MTRGAKPSPAALDAALSIIAEALSRQTGERWVPLAPNNGDAIPRPTADGRSNSNLADQRGGDTTTVV